MNDTLYIIGNGFDLHHGLPTTYANFRDKLAKKIPVLWNYLSIVYGDEPNHDQWWWNFEAMLSKIDYESIMKSNNGLALGANKVSNFFKEVLPPFFGRWINDVDNKIDILNIQKEEYIDNNALFFTFNYTLLLEKLYKVPKENVWHIHHSVLSIDEIIIGHDSDEQELYTEYSKYRNKHQILRPDIADNIRSEILKGAKGVNNRVIRHNEDFYRLYPNIRHIIAMGFSFNDIDMPYIQKIVEVNNNIADVHWTLYFHSDGDDIRMKNKLIQIGIKEECINFKKW